MVRSSRVQKKAFDADADGTIDVDVEGEFDEGFAVLASRAMVVTKDSFYDEPIVAPVADSDRDPAAMRSPSSSISPCAARTRKPPARHWRSTTKCLRGWSPRPNCGPPSRR